MKQISMPIEFTSMTAADYDACMTLWQGMEGMGLSEVDSRDGINAYLNRNPGLSLVARIQGQIIGTVLCGHDGRRGFLHHVAVALAHRKQGIAKAMVERCLARLAAEGIQKCHLFIHKENRNGEWFWRRIGWKERVELMMMSKDSGLPPQV
jgi:putative acetyltransferase